jgi:hypothetical protein
VTRVIYRKEANHILAFFPESDEGDGTYSCYSHVGQHSGASWEYILHQTLPVDFTEGDVRFEVCRLHNVLVDMGYTDLKEVLLEQYMKSVQPPLFDS